MNQSSSINTTADPYEHLSSVIMNIHFIVMSYLEPCMSTVAIVTNLVVIVVFAQRDAAANLGPTVRLYYLAIAIYDIISIIDYRIIVSFISYGIEFATGGAVVVNLSHSNDVACKLSYYIYNTAEQCSGYTFVLFSIERACALYFPLKARTIFSYKRVKIISACIYLAIAAFNIHLLVSMVYVFTSYADCRSGYGVLAGLFYFTVGDVDYGMPFLLILVINCLSVARIRAASRRRNQITAVKKDDANSSKEKSALGTVLLLSAAHCIIFFPVALLQTWDAINYADLVVVNATFAFAIDQLAWIAFHFAIFGKIINIVIYYLKVPYFHRKIREPKSCFRSI